MLRPRRIRCGEIVAFSGVVHRVVALDPWGGIWHAGDAKGARAGRHVATGVRGGSWVVARGERWLDPNTLQVSAWRRHMRVAEAFALLAYQGARRWLRSQKKGTFYFSCRFLSGSGISPPTGRAICSHFHDRQVELAAGAPVRTLHIYPLPDLPLVRCHTPTTMAPRHQGQDSTVDIPRFPNKAREMARGPRTDYEGALNHVMNRGARRAAIFDVDEHAGAFLCALGETASRFDFEVHADCIMPNHYHLLVRTPCPGAGGPGKDHRVGT